MKRRSADNGVLAALPAGARAVLEPQLEFCEFRQGRVIYQPHDAIERMYFPIDGVLSILTVMADGAAVETATVGREGAVGLSSALAPVHSHGRTISQTPGAMFVLPSTAMRAVAAESAAVREVIVRYADVVLRQAQQSTACNILHDVEERFCRWLLTCDDRVQGARVELTQEFLAMMLGVQRTTVSQVASSLQAAGLIRYNRGRIDILDRPALELRSCECYDVVRRETRAFLPTAGDRLTPTTSEDSAEIADAS